MLDWTSNRYPVKVVRWVDGDTVELQFDLSQNTLRQESYRLALIDAAGVTRREAKSELQKKVGRELAAYLTQAFPPGTMFIASTEKDEGKFGRYVVTLFELSSPETSLNAWLLYKELVVPYGSPWTEEKAQIALERLNALRAYT